MTTEWDYDKEYHDLRVMYDDLFDKANELEQSNAALRERVNVQDAQMKRAEENARIFFEDWVGETTGLQDVITAWTMEFE